MEKTDSPGMPLRCSPPPTIPAQAEGPTTARFPRISPGQGAETTRPQAGVLTAHRTLGQRVLGEPAWLGRPPRGQVSGEHMDYKKQADVHAAPGETSEPTRPPIRAVRHQVGRHDGVAPCPIRRDPARIPPAPPRHQRPLVEPRCRDHPQTDFSRHLRFAALVDLPANI
jgi:hypothetical protein